MLTDLEIQEGLKRPRDASAKSFRCRADDIGKGPKNPIDQKGLSALIRAAHRNFHGTKRIRNPAAIWL